MQTISPITPVRPGIIPVNVAGRPSLSLPAIVTTLGAINRFRAPIMVASQPVVRPPIIQPIVRTVVVPTPIPAETDRTRFFSGKSRKSTAKLAPDASYLDNDEVTVVS